MKTSSLPTCGGCAFFFIGRLVEDRIVGWGEGGGGERKSFLHIWNKSCSCLVLGNKVVLKLSSPILACREGMGALRVPTVHCFMRVDIAGCKMERYRAVLFGTVMLLRYRELKYCVARAG